MSNATELAKFKSSSDVGDLDKKDTIPDTPHPLKTEKDQLKGGEVQEETKPKYFSIGVSDLEDLMSKYKERGSNFLDLKAIDDLGGEEGILRKLKTDANNGIKSLNHREEEFGSNKVFIEPVPPYCHYVWEATKDLMIRILAVASVVQIILGVTLSDDPSKDWIDGLSMMIAIFVVVGVSSVTNWRKETKFHELSDYQNQGTKYKVIRHGQPEDMKSDDLLVGDIINIMVGEIMPADLMLIDGNGLKMDESSLTGESDTMKKENYEKCVEDVQKGAKKPASPLILSGTNCVEGTGIAVVLAVGDHSQKGMIKRTVDNAQENNLTPLEQKLEKLASSVGIIGLSACGITLITLIIRFLVRYFDEMEEYEHSGINQSLVASYAQNYPNELSTNKKMSSILRNELTNPKSNVSSEILDIILLCISMVAVALPEGLPLAVTLSLAFSIKKLMDQNNLVRKMHACETMGGANYICTDKTGTLTKNEMNVYKVLTIKEEMTLTETIDNFESVGANPSNKADISKKPREDASKYFKNENYWATLKSAIALNIDGAIKTFGKPDINGDMEECETKNKTDKAFIDMLYQLKSPISAERTTYSYNVDNMKQIPFDSKRKRMTTFIHCDKFTTSFRLFTKGGAENVKKICKFYLDPDTGEVKEIQDSQKDFIASTIEKFNKQMLRSLYVCYKDINEDEYNTCEDHPSIDQENLVFLAIVGIRDSLRNGVKEAVLKCHRASVNVVMVTGDNIVTATAIAKDCNILGKDVDLQNMTPNDIEQNPELTNDPAQRDKHLEEVIATQPKAITGNTFYAAVGGLMCNTCKEDSNVCKCPKTEAEAIDLAKQTGEPQKPIKNDVIKYQDKFITLAKHLRVMARSQPIHKYALVLGLKELKYVVGVTGDGTNDAPALSKSDVGFAMFAGTDIAKDASDIVILDNNFSSIVIAIMYGRNIYDNIRKFLQFQLAVNFCACLLVFICALVGNESPLSPIQMLWINLILDSLGSLALATEPPYEELLNRRPTGKTEPIINGKMWKHIILQAIVLFVILIVLYLLAPEIMKERDPVRLAENRIIFNCYGGLPGYEIGDTSKLDHIIYGTSIYWYSDRHLILGMDETTCGKYSSNQDLAVAIDEYTKAYANTVHMTVLFNICVLYTLFNQINSRVIDDTLNIFVRITNNIMFPLVMLAEVVLQVIMIEFGNEGFKVVEGGLTWDQWLISVGFSLIAFVLALIIKLIPIDQPLDRWIMKEEFKPKPLDIINIDDGSNKTMESNEHERSNGDKNNNQDIKPSK